MPFPVSSPASVCVATTAPAPMIAADLLVRDDGGKVETSSRRILKNIVSSTILYVSNWSLHPNQKKLFCWLMRFRTFVSKQQSYSTSFKNVVLRGFVCIYS